MTHIKPVRRDVARHRSMLLEAASQVFSDQGGHAPLDAVAEAAGVGRATLYRHFPDRTALLLALFERDIMPILNEGEGEPAGDVLFTMLKEMGRVTRKAPVIEDAWRAIAPHNPEMQARQRDLLARFEKPLADAIAAGQVRPDLTLDDVISVGRMIVAANRHACGDDSAGDRILDLMLNGIRRSE